MMASSFCKVFVSNLSTRRLQELGSVPSRRNTTGISAFRKTYPGLRLDPGLVIAPTREVLQVSEQDWVIPWDLAGG